MSAIVIPLGKAGHVSPFGDYEFDDPPIDVRSHRRGPYQWSPPKWVTYTVVTVLCVAGVGFGYTQLRGAGEGCKEPAKATILAAPSVAPVLQKAADNWLGTYPTIGGRCVELDIVGKESPLVAQILGSQWDNEMGAAPDAWVPESSAWAERATSAGATGLIPDNRPSLASTPTVIAMPKPMADKLGGSTLQLTWQDMIYKYPVLSWWKYGTDWGLFTFGMTDPLGSTAGLHALIALMDANKDGQITPEEQAAALHLRMIPSTYNESTEQFFKALSVPAWQADGSRQISAFPALERDVFKHNTGNPSIPLTALYPTDGSIDADYPYLALKTPWSTSDRQEVVNSFGAYLTGATGVQVFLDEGFRAPDRSPGKGLDPANGISTTLAAPVRTAPKPGTVQQTINMWTALTRITNILLVLDVTGSMNQPVPGVDKTKLQLVQDAARSAVNLMADDTYAGLWSLAARPGASTDYQQLVGIGRLSGPIGNGPRRDAMISSIDSIQTGSNTGLFNTILAAQSYMYDNYQPDAANLVVVMTDGLDGPGQSGITLDQMKQQLATGRDNKKVQLITVAYGNRADTNMLTELSKATGAQSYAAKSEYDITNALLTAIFDRT